MAIFEKFRGRLAIGSRMGPLVLALAGWACGSIPAGRVDLEGARGLVTNPAVFLLDVRTREEFESGWIDRATLIPIRELASRMKELPEDKATPILVYCQSGWRSAVAADRIRKAGYADVVDFAGGMAAWRAAGLPVATFSPKQKN